jgi:hypothetical protein
VCILISRTISDSGLADHQIPASISTKHKSHCEVCGARFGGELLTFPGLPLSEILVPQKQAPVGFVDQAFSYCDSCGHGQLRHVVPPEVLYGSGYGFRSSLSTVSRAGNLHFANFIREVTADRKFGSIIDIGCNDLFLLREFETHADKLYGIDPMLRVLGATPPSKKFILIPEYFEKVSVRDLMSDKGTLVISSHNLEHIESPRAMFERLLAAANEETIFAFQFPGLETLITNYRFDQIFHQHLHYFSFPSISRLLNEVGAKIIAYKTNPSFWGSILILFTKRGKFEPDQILPLNILTSTEILERYEIFKSSMKVVADTLKLESGNRKLAFGAALTLPNVAYHLGDAFSAVECVLDDDPAKDGLSYLSLPIEIFHSQSISNFDDTVVIVTALNNVRQLVPRLIAANARRILIPLSNF